MTPSERDTSPIFPSPTLHPSLLALPARARTLLRPILVAEGTAASCQDDVRVVQIPEQRLQPQSIHSTRDDGRRLRHVLPILVVVRTIRLALLQHEGDVLVRIVALHLAETPGANMDSSGTDDARNLGVNKRRVTTLSLRARQGAVSSTVVM
jgi:hypothetical protein